MPQFLLSGHSEFLGKWLPEVVSISTSILQVSSHSCKCITYRYLFLIRSLHTSCTHARTHARTNNCFTALWFFRDNPGEPVPKETFTHSHLSWSSIILYLLPPSIAIHDIALQHIIINVLFTVPSVLWRCRLGGRKGIWPVKNWVVGC